jgi:hypothetical protein
MKKKSNPPKVEELAGLVRKYQKTLERAKKLYERADDLLQEIAAGFTETCKTCKTAHLKPNAEIPLTGDGKKAILEDNYANEDIVWGHGGVRHYGIKIKNA